MSKIFGTDGIRCLVNQEPLSVETCLKISKTVAYVLRNKDNKTSRVIICKDTRLSGYLYEPLVTAGFISLGISWAFAYASSSINDKIIKSQFRSYDYCIS